MICCRGTAAEAMTVMRAMMAAVKLTVNETKTQVRQVPAETFDFLGYTFGLHWTHRTRRKLLCGAPSKKRMARVCKRISTITNRKRSGLDPTEVVTELNRVLRGWAGYFCLGPVSDAYRAINAHTRHAVPQVVGCQAQERPFRVVLVLEPVAGTDVWAAPTPLGPVPPAACERVNLLREPDAGNPHVRFDERDVETEQGPASEAPATERAGNR